MSIRYLDSYGMFWAGIRNLLKARGLVAFKEHFPIPSNLGKFKEKIIESCGLEKKSLGKSGLQKANIELWIKEKKTENKSQTLGVSIAIDGKKIAASSKGVEDLGDLSGGKNASDEEIEHRDKTKKMLNLIDSLDDRNSCFALYDCLTQETCKLVHKLDAIENLLKKNSKQLEKNSNLAKYIFVLNQQKAQGKNLIETLHKIQTQLIASISVSRKCENFIPSMESNSVNLTDQPNYFQLNTLIHKVGEAEIICKKIDAIVDNHANLLVLPWDELESISGNLHTLSRDNLVYKHIYKTCYLTDDEVFQACGLGKQRPLADMKDVYEAVQSKIVSRTPLQKPNQSVIATFAANFSPMTFGRNMVAKDGGLYTNDGLISAPDLIVLDVISNRLEFCNRIEFCVKVIHVETQTFKIKDEMVVAGILSSFLVNAVRGCLVVLHSDVSCVVYNVPRNDELAQKMLGFIGTFLNQSKCLTRRKKEMIAETASIQKEILEAGLNVKILGSYPLVGTTIVSGIRRDVLGEFSIPSIRPKQDVKVEHCSVKERSN